VWIVCGYVDKSVLTVPLRDLVRGQMLPTILDAPVDAGIEVRSDLVRGDATHARVERVATLAHATDALLLAEELLVALDASQEVEIELDNAFHARESHIPALPVALHFQQKDIEGSGLVEASVVLCHRFGVGRCVLHAQSISREELQCKPLEGYF